MAAVGLAKDEAQRRGDHATLNGEAGPKIDAIDTLSLVLETLTSSVTSTLSYLEGPLAQALRARLHDQDGLPDERLSQLAADAVNVLHTVQRLLEPRSAILADHFLGYVNSKCLNAAVERNVPDVLAGGPMTLERLSEASGARPDRLAQVLRVLYNNGIFDFDPATGTYRNNDASSLLRSDHWTQWRNWVELYGNQMYDMARGIPESTRKHMTRSPAQINFETDANMFAYFQEQGWVGLLHRTLGGGAEAMAPGILQDYPWHELDDGASLLIDVGGGGGGLIATLLRRYKKLRGGIYDLPHVVEQAKAAFHGPGAKYADVAARIAPESLVGGDFFDSVPPSETYVMKWCLHDWKDPEAVKILSNIRRAMVTGPKSRLVVMETILSDGQAQRLSRYGDVHMMMTANGQERTEAHWRDLVQQAGWEVRKIYHLRNAWVKAIELLPSAEVQAGNREVRHLRSQHDWIKASMGSLLHCPVNQVKESMRILDSGTADGMFSFPPPLPSPPLFGHWLTDLASVLPKSTQFVGTDITTYYFPPSPPPNIQFVKQSVTEAWPSDWHASFDVVHQKLVLSSCDPAAAQKVVASLFALAKPGGWVQLLECDHSGGFSPEQAARAPATARFGQLVLRCRAAAGTSGQYGLSLRRWLRAAGARDVVETLLNCPVGALAPTPELRRSTTENLLSVVRGLQAARGDIPGLDLDANYFDQLHEDLQRELSTVGSFQRFHLVYGRRSLNTAPTLANGNGI